MAGRTTSAALDVELAKAVTEIGYLVLVGTTTPQRWSNIGAATWNALAWVERSFSVEGLDFNSDSDLTARLSIANHDGVAGALFMAPAEHLYDILITIYQFARGAVAVDDVPLMATMSVDSCQITNERVTLELTESNTDAKFSPARTIAPSYGFNFATPAGTVIPWGDEIYTTEPSDG